jgi:hypothetical protein
MDKDATEVPLPVVVYEMLYPSTREIRIRLGGMLAPESRDRTGIGRVRGILFVRYG